MTESSSMAVTDSAGAESIQSCEQTVKPKRKRNLPGMPDPDSEVIALSPKSLMETNRYVCDVCGKGFQRDQNLQLHRRGHNMPWKLKQRPPDKEFKKRVYVCPEPSCVHHDPSRALGDLTGIKKHFCRKHGEKKFKCERCSKSYAVQCDWKAHMKICGTREYTCDCGTVFSRRDSFITHRAFCDALAQESVKVQDLTMSADPKTLSSLSPPPQPPTPSTVVLSPALSIQSSELPENQSGHSQQKKETPPISTDNTNSINKVRARGGSLTSSANINWKNSEVLDGAVALSGHSSEQQKETPLLSPATTSNVFELSESSQQKQISSTLCNGNNNSNEAFSGVFALSMPAIHPEPSPSYSNFFGVPNGSTTGVIEPMSLSLSTPLYPSSNSSSLFLSTAFDNRQTCASTPQPALSATALLQKAAIMGSKSSTSFLQGLGLSMSSGSDLCGDKSACANPDNNNSIASSGLGLGLQSTHSMIEPPTLDFLGVGLGSNKTSSDQYPALLSSVNRRNHFGLASSSFGGVFGGKPWDDPSRKPGFL